ncbi:unnamed protein product [Sphagnum compactum]
MHFFDSSKWRQISSTILNQKALGVSINNYLSFSELANCLRSSSLDAKGPCGAVDQTNRQNSPIGKFTSQLQKLETPFTEFNCVFLWRFDQQAAELWQVPKIP